MDAIILALILLIAIAVLVWDALRALGLRTWVILALAAMFLVGLVEAFVGAGPTWWPMIAAGAVGVVGLGRRMLRRAAEV